MKINDGMWHHVQVSQNGVRKKRKITVTLDGKVKKTNRMPKNNIRNEVYIGGIPENFSDHTGLVFLQFLKKQFNTFLISEKRIASIQRVLTLLENKR